MTSHAVADPADWTSTVLPFVTPLDAALRCQICKDFYKAPMMTDCCHTFCSLCIRRALNADQKCPVCRKPGQEAHLRKNNVLEEVLETFVAARALLLSFAMQLGADHTRDEGGVPGSAQRLQTVKYKAASRPLDTCKNDLDMHEQVVIEEDKVQNDGLVPCPICHQRMKEAQVSAHIDGCLIQGQEAAPRRLRSSNIQSPALNPLPKINYSFLKDKELRAKLRELGISSDGNRKILQDRHTEWMHLWNANVDSRHPRSKSELLQELSRWEQVRARPENRPTKSSNWSDEKWAEAHKAQLGDLVKQAKESAAAAKKRKLEGLAEKNVGLLGTSSVRVAQQVQQCPAKSIAAEEPLPDVPQKSPSANSGLELANETKDYATMDTNARPLVSVLRKRKLSLSERSLV